MNLPGETKILTGRDLLIGTISLVELQYRLGVAFAHRYHGKEINVLSLHFPNLLLYVSAFHTCNLYAFTFLEYYLVRIGYKLQNSFLGRLEN